MKKINNWMMVIWIFFGMIALSMDLWMEIPELIHTAPEYVSYNEREYLRPEWLNDHFQKYYNEVDFFINEDPKPDSGMCYIDFHNDIYINTDVESRSDSLRDGKRCMAHEVGHYIDRRNGFPSETVEFHRAVDLAARVDWSIAHWPCLYDNPCDGWGDYGELYAELFMRESIADIPAVLWDWYLPYYR